MKAECMEPRVKGTHAEGSVCRQEARGHRE